MYQGEAVYTLESKDFSNSGKPTIRVSDISKGRRIKAFLLRLDATITQPSSSAALILGSKLKRIFSSVVIGKRVRATGMLLRALNWHMMGREFGLNYDVPATNSGVFNRVIETIIPYEDPRAQSPNDTVVNTEFFDDTAIELGFDSVASVFGAGVTVAGQLRVHAIHMGAEPNMIPSATEINYEDWSQKTLLLPAGLYTHLGFYDDAGAAITDANFIDATVKVDGETVLDKMKLSELSALFNRAMAEGTSVEATSASAPIGGEVLTDQPAAGNAAGAAVSTEFVPLFTPTDKYQLSKCMRAEKGIRIDINGAGTSFRAYYRKVEKRAAASVVKAATKIGVTDASRRTAEVKTHSKQPLQKAWLADYLPLRVR